MLNKFNNIFSPATWGLYQEQSIKHRPLSLPQQDQGRTKCDRDLTSCCGWCSSRMSCSWYPHFHILQASHISEFHQKRNYYFWDILLSLRENKLIHFLISLLFDYITTFLISFIVASIYDWCIIGSFPKRPSEFKVNFQDFFSVLNNY